MKDKLTLLVRQIREINTEHAHLDGFADRQTLGPPADRSELAEIERDFSIRLPDDYRFFLLMHNGWKSFIGDRDLLSTEQMRQGPTHEWLQELKHIQREVSDFAAAEGFVIEASENGTTITFIDTSSPNSHQPEIVEWSDEEFRRHESFTAYLEGVVVTLIDLLQEKLERR